MRTKTIHNAITTPPETMTLLEVRTPSKFIGQVVISDTASVKLQGRVNSAYDWKDLATYSASGGGVVDAYPEMQFSVVSIGAGNVTIGAAYDDATRT